MSLVPHTIIIYRSVSIASLNVVSICLVVITIYARAHPVVLDRLKAYRNRENSKKERREPPRNTRLRNKLEETRKDLGKLYNIKDGKKQATAKSKYKYRLTRKGVTTVIEELSQRMINTVAKIKRYSGRVNQFHKNRD